MINEMESEGEIQIKRWCKYCIVQKEFVKIRFTVSNFFFFFERHSHIKCNFEESSLVRSYNSLP